MNDLLNDDTFLARWFAGTLSAAELKQFQQHPQYAQYQQLAKQTSGLKVQQPDEEAILRNIKAKSKKQATPLKNITNRPERMRRLLIRSIISAAAIALLAIGYFQFIGAQPLRISTPVGATLVHVLPDGSSVLLNSNSAIVYSANTFKKERNLRLDGEAFFEVRAGRSFVVQTSNGSVTVLGTSFSVYSRDQSDVIACKTGRVQVQNNTGQSRILGPGARVIIKDGLLEAVATISIKSIATWDSGVSSFESDYLSVVTQSIENQFGININLPDKIANERYTGSFLHSDVETALKMVFDPMGFRYTQVGPQEWEVAEN